MEKTDQIEEAQISESLCPNCGKERFWIKIYNDKEIKYCIDCEYFEEV